MTREEAIAKILEHVPHIEVADYRYVNKPVVFYDDLKNGVMTLHMYLVLDWVWRTATYNTGIVSRASAEMIRQDIWPNRKGRPHITTVQRAVRLCAICGYIEVPNSYEHDQNYPICACGYALTSAGATYLIRPKAIYSYRDVLKTCASLSARGSAEHLRNLCGTSAQPVRDFCGTSADSSISRTVLPVKTEVTEEAVEQAAPETGLKPTEVEDIEVEELQ